MTKLDFQDVQFIWWIAHLCTVYNGLKYYLYILGLSTQSPLAYRLVFLSSIATNGLILLKAGEVTSSFKSIYRVIT